MDASYEFWTDKYMPQHLDEIIGQDSNIKRLKRLSKLKVIPHIIISGNSGVGKTLSVKCFLKEMGIKRNNILDVNITEDIRKATIIKKKIYNFVDKKMDRKVILIDDCDILNTQMQFLIKSIMEKARENLTIIMICNQIENIIETIQSRSILLRFKKINDQKIKEYLSDICKKEKIKSLKEEVLSTIVLCSLGDIRRAINNLQTICVSFNEYDKITTDDVYDILEIPQPKIIRGIIEDGDYTNMLKTLNKVIKMGYSTNDIIVSFFNVVKDMDIDIDKKIKYIDEITFTNIKINDGLDSRLQLYKLLISFLD